MRLLNITLEGCIQCPYYKSELVLKESGRGYEKLHACKKYFRAICYEDQKHTNNDPVDNIPGWCELPKLEKEDNNVMLKASSAEEERLS